MWISKLVDENDADNWCLQNDMYQQIESVEIITDNQYRFSAKLVFGSDHYENVDISRSGSSKKIKIKGYRTGYSEYQSEYYLNETSDNIFGLATCN